MSGSRSTELTAILKLIEHTESVASDVNDTMRTIMDILERLRLQDQMLLRIWDALKPTSADGEESPLETLLRSLVQQGHQHGESLRRIEAALSRR
jgi:hypothetical protein